MKELQKGLILGSVAFFLSCSTDSKKVDPILLPVSTATPTPEMFQPKFLGYEPLDSTETLEGAHFAELFLKDEFKPITVNPGQRFGQELVPIIEDDPNRFITLPPRIVWMATTPSDRENIFISIEQDFTDEDFVEKNGIEVQFNLSSFESNQNLNFLLKRAKNGDNSRDLLMRMTAGVFNMPPYLCWGYRTIDRNGPGLLNAHGYLSDRSLSYELISTGVGRMMFNRFDNHEDYGNRIVRCGSN